MLFFEEIYYRASSHMKLDFSNFPFRKAQFSIWSPCKILFFIFFTALQNDIVRDMIMKADLEALESVVLDGHGGSLLDEPAASNKVRAFIRSVPNYLVSFLKICFLIIRSALKLEKKCNFKSAKNNICIFKSGK